MELALKNKIFKQAYGLPTCDWPFSRFSENPQIVETTRHD